MAIKNEIKNKWKQIQESRQTFFAIPLDNHHVSWKKDREFITESEFFKLTPRAILFVESISGKETISDVTDLFEAEPVPLTPSDLDTIGKNAKAGVLTHELFNPEKMDSDVVQSLRQSLIDAANDLGFYFWQLASYVLSKESETDMDTLAGSILDLSQGDTLVVKSKVKAKKEAYDGFKRWMKKYISRIPDDEAGKLQDYWSEGIQESEGSGVTVVSRLPSKLYHGSPTPITAFDVDKGDGRFGKGLYLIPDLNKAQFYAAGGRQGAPSQLVKKGTGHVYEVKIKSNRILKVTDPEEAVRELLDIPEIEDEVGNAWRDSGGDPTVAKVTRFYPYLANEHDANVIWYKEKDAGVLSSFEQILVLDNSAISSFKEISSAVNEDINEEQIDKIVDELVDILGEDEHIAVGIRVDDKNFPVGTKLHRSRIISDGIPTGEMLPGTSVLEITQDWGSSSRKEIIKGLTDALRYSKNYGEKYAHIVTGKVERDVPWEDRGEMVISNAKVILRLADKLKEFDNQQREDNDSIEEDRQETMLRNLSKKAKTSYRKLKAKFLDIERGVSRSIDKSDPKFWPIVISTLKKSFDITEDYDADDLLQKALDEFGRTSTWSQAGYLLPDGVLLNFGQHGQRGEDHRGIAIVFEDPPLEGWDAVQTFMEETGAIRFLPETNGFDMYTAPTRKQIQKIREYAEVVDGEVIIEMAGGAQPFYQEYDKGSDVEGILNDIKKYYRIREDWPHKTVLQDFGEIKKSFYEAEPKLNKPMRGDVKKYKVYVKDPKTGNVKKVNFGDPNMEIKRDDPERRKSFRARHKCDQAKDKTTPKYWSCKFWSKEPVSKLLKKD